MEHIVFDVFFYKNYVFYVSMCFTKISNVLFIPPQYKLQIRVFFKEKILVFFKITRKDEF